MASLDITEERDLEREGGGGEREGEREVGRDFECGRVKLTSTN